MQGRSFLRKTGFTYQMHSFLTCIFPQIATDSFSLARNDSTVKLKRLCREPIWMVSDFSTAFWSSVYSSFLFLCLGFLHMGIRSILNYYVLLYFLCFLCLLFFRAPILTCSPLGTYCGLIRASDLQFCLFLPLQTLPKSIFLLVNCFFLSSYLMGCFFLLFF